jgi:hypothetical protein
MLREAPPAAGPTGTAGRSRATQELHGAVRSCTAGCGPNRDHRPRSGRGSYASTHAHLGIAGRWALWRPQAASGPEEMRDLELTYASTHAYLDIAGSWDPQGTAGHGRGRKNCVTRSGYTDVDMT